MHRPGMPPSARCRGDADLHRIDGGMPSCSFYATTADHLTLVGVILGAGEYTVLPAYSRVDQPLSPCAGIGDLIAASELGVLSTQFVVHHASFGGAIHRRRIELRPDVGSFRWEATGWGLISLVLSAPRKGALGPGWTNHNSEARARKWEPTFADCPDRINEWNWAEITRHSGHINRLIRRLSVSKLGSRWVLPDAAAAFAEGRNRVSLN